MVIGDRVSRRFCVRLCRSILVHRDYHDGWEAGNHGDHLAFVYRTTKEEERKKSYEEGARLEDDCEDWDWQALPQGYASAGKSYAD